MLEEISVQASIASFINDAGNHDVLLKADNFFALDLALGAWFLLHEQVANTIKTKQRCEQGQGNRNSIYRVFCAATYLILIVFEDNFVST